MKCVHVVPGIAHEASGPSYSVPRLCEHLAALGMDIKMMTSDREPTKQYTFPILWFQPQPPFADRLGRSPQLRKALADSVASVDIVHNHSLWMMSNVYAGQLVKGQRAKLVTSPRGTLSTWALSRGWCRKQLLWYAGQRLAVSRASLLHATSEGEHDDIRKLGFKQPIAIIPNGCDIPELPQTVSHKTVRRMLYLGRIHPVKGLDNLVTAWSSLGSATSDWELQFVGPGETEHLRRLRESIGQTGCKNITLRGEVYGDSKSEEYFSASVFVLPSHSENFAMTVAEALAHGLPCIVSKGAPWKQLESERCGWWIENDSKSLAKVLRQVMATHPTELQASGMRGRAYVQKALGWTAIASEMSQVYEWVVHGGTAPKCVRE